jgi:hypothetical protein
MLSKHVTSKSRKSLWLVLMQLFVLLSLEREIEWRKCAVYITLHRFIFHYISLYYIYVILVYIIILYRDDNPVYYLWNERLYTCILYGERDLCIQIHRRGVYTHTQMRTNYSFVYIIGFGYNLVLACACVCAWEVYLRAYGMTIMIQYSSFSYILYHTGWLHVSDECFCKCITFLMWWWAPCWA